MPPNNDDPQPEPARPPRSEFGVGLVDCLAFVVGGALASLLVRDVIPQHEAPDPASNPAPWIALLGGLLFLGVTLSVTGPVVVALRRIRGVGTGPLWRGEYLWLAVATPWFGLMLLRLAEAIWFLGLAPPAPDAPPPWNPHGRDAALQAIRPMVLVLFCLAFLFAFWLLTQPDQIPHREAESPLANARRPWTHWLGLALGVTWPLQVLLLSLVV